MSVEYVKGNVLNWLGGSSVLIHGVSQQGVFAAGVAKQIAEEYPAAKDAYMEAHAKGELQLGSFTTAVVGSKRIVNLVTQHTVGTDRRQVDYEALHIGLGVIRDILFDAGKEGRHYVATMPWIGTGLAGGSRAIVKAIIEDVFEASPIKVVVVEYAKSA